MKRNSALLIVIAIVLVLTLGLAACNNNDAPPQDEKATYSVSIPSGEGYTVVGAASVKEGEDYSFQVNIANGYNGTDMVVKVNGNTVVKTGNAYVVNSVSGNLVITVTGVKKNAPDTYTVTLPSGNGFTASGETTVTAGSNYTFTVTVATGYDVSALVVKNGEATLTATSTEGNVVSYTINNVQSNITLTATIAKIKFSVTLPTGEGYAVEGESEAAYGEDYSFTVYAAAGYSVKDAVVKNGNVTLTGVNGKYTVANVTANVVITVENVVKLQNYVSVTTRVYDIKLADITDAQKAAAYYMTGVSGVYNNESCEVTADLSAVDFTRAGTYTITYKLVGHEDVTETATVNIYGEPTITVASDAIKAVAWSENLDLNAFITTLIGKISAVDSVNNSLTVNVKAATVPAKNAYGFYAIQSYSVTFTATDKMGNIAEETVQITITGSTDITVAPTMNIDLANTSVMLAAYEAGVDFDLFKYDTENGLVAVTTAQAAWDSDKEGSFFVASYLASLELGEHTFVLVFEDTFKVVTLTLTDNQAPAFTTSDVMELAYIVGDEFVLPTAVKNANSAQAITVKYFLGNDEFTANPTAAGSYTYTIKFYRNNEELTAYSKEYSLTLVTNYGWGGANVGATADGKISLSGVTSGDMEAVLSADYINANKGDNNIVIVTVKALDMGTTESPSLWYVTGKNTEGNDTYFGWTKDNGFAVGSTLSMRFDLDERAVSFILRDFDGKLEVVNIEYNKFDENFSSGYAESFDVTYDESKKFITNVEFTIATGRDWDVESPEFTTTYLNKLKAADIKYIVLAPTYTDLNTALVYQYYDENGTKIEKYDLTSGSILTVDSFAATNPFKISKINHNTPGKTSADTISVALTYYTQAQYDAAQAELAKAAARGRLANITTNADSFYSYLHFGGWIDGESANSANWGTDNKIVTVTGTSVTIQKTLIEDASAAEYKYLVIRVKSTDKLSNPIDHICFTSNPTPEYYWAQVSGYEAVFRIDLSKYYGDYTFDGTDVITIAARNSSASAMDCTHEVEIIGFEEENDKVFISASNRWDYTITGDLYAELSAGGSTSFTIKARDAYAIDSVVCDGATVTREGDVWTISDVTKDANLVVTTRRIRHNVIISQGTGFTADAYNKQVDEGNSVSFTITANTDWAIDEVTCDDANVTITNEGDVWTFSNVTKDIAVTVKVHSTAIVDKEYKITVAQGEGFTVAETLPVTSLNGADVALRITAKDGYRIDSVTANNGATVKFDGNYYIIGNITSDTELTVATTNVANIAKEAEERLSNITKNADGFVRYFGFGCWGDETWGTGAVTVIGGNLSINRNFIDDALAAGYTHAKLHIKVVANDGTAISSIKLVTEPGQQIDYYLKWYNCDAETDIRIDLTVFANADHTTDALKVYPNGGSVDSHITLSAIEFYKSEETTTWTKSSNSVYFANENGKYVLDTVGGGNNANVVSDETWFTAYFGSNSNSNRYIAYTDCGYIIQRGNERPFVWGVATRIDGIKAGSGSFGNVNGNTLYLEIEQEGVSYIKFAGLTASVKDNVAFTQSEKTITVTSVEGLQLYFNELAKLKGKYKYIKFTVADPSALVGSVWFGNGAFGGENAYMADAKADNGYSVVVDLSKCSEKLILHFTAAETNVTINYEFIANYKKDKATELVAEGLDSTKATVVKFKYEVQGSNARAPIYGKTSANIVNALPFNECTDLGDGWYQFTINAGTLDEDGNLYFTLDADGSIYYEITQE